MTLAGLPLATLLGIAAASGGITVLLYLLRFRIRRVAVPFVRVWESALRDKKTAEWLSRLRRILSLLLQLLLLALLLLALGDPRFEAARSEARNLVFLVDVSASMQAKDVLPSRLEAAKAELRKFLGSLGEQDLSMVVEVGTRPRPLTSLTRETSELQAAVERITARDTGADLDQAVRYALDVLRGLAHGEIVVFSDGAWGRVEGGENLGETVLRYIPVGVSAQNVAISEFSVRRYPLDRSRAEVMLEVTNYGPESTEVELTLLGDGRAVEVTRFALAPGEAVPRFYPDLSGVEQKLEASVQALDGRDQLAVDNHAFALMPARQRTRVLLVTTGNTYLEATFLLDEYLDVEVMNPSRYPAPGEFDVAVFDGVTPDLTPGIHAVLYLNPSGVGPPLKVARQIRNFGFDQWDKKSPVLRRLALEDVQVTRGSAFLPQAGDRVLGSSELGPILVSGTRERVPFIALGFDPRDSDFVLRVAWPLFVMNAINNLVHEDVSYIESYRTGEAWQIPVPAQTQSASLVDPSGAAQSLVVRQGRAAYRGERSGFYRLLLKGEDQNTTEQELAANLGDPQESRIAPQNRFIIGGRPAERVPSFVPSFRKAVWTYLLFIAALLSVIEWASYNRRLTV